MRKKKKIETNSVEEQEPRVDSARPPELSERRPVEAGPAPEFTEDTEKEAEPTVNPKLEKAFPALMGLPGLSAKMKFQIFKVLESKIDTEDKEAIMQAVGSIRGVDETKQKTIQKVLERVL